MLPLVESTPIHLAVVSALADGADRIVVRAVRDDARRCGESAQLEAMLPYPQKRYVEKQGFSRASEEEFRELLAVAVVDEPPEDQVMSSDDAYVHAGMNVVNRCDVLIAIWRGDPTGGKGGTAETLLAAAWAGRPCIWITPDGDRVETNLGRASECAAFYAEVARRANPPEPRTLSEPVLKTDPLKPLCHAYRDIVAFNQARLPPAFDERVERMRQMTSAPDAWVAGPLARASILAARYRRRFTRIAWAVSLLAVAAAGALASTLAYNIPAGWAWAEFGSLAVAGLLLHYGRTDHTHEKWLSFRVLAERLRSCHYIAAIGIDYRNTAAFEGVYVERASQDWVIRAFEEIWTRRPAGVKVSEWDAARSLICTWLDEQIGYHERSADRHRLSQVWLTRAVIACLGATLVVAALHALHRGYEDTIVFCSIVLPAVTGALGVILSVGQHRALRERSARMNDDLLRSKRTLDGAETLADVAAVGSEAARIIALESGDWYGAMWFVELEHV
jgi:hypothetical protein